MSTTLPLHHENLVVVAIGFIGSSNNESVWVIHGQAIRPDWQQPRNETYVAEGRISLAVAEATISMAREEKLRDKDKEVCVDRG